MKYIIFEKDGQRYLSMHGQMVGIKTIPPKHKRKRQARLPSCIHGVTHRSQLTMDHYSKR